MTTTLEAPTAPMQGDWPTLRIAHLYPSLLNVAGDGGNLMAIQQRCAWRGIPTLAVSIDAGDRPDFSTFDIVLFHGGQDVEMEIVAADLGLKAPSLREAADQGVVIFAVCAGLQLLGARYVPSDGPPMEGAAVLDLETRGGPQRFMQHAAVDVTIDGRRGTIVGFENHSGQTELGPDAQPLGMMIAGAGNNGRDGTEGAVRGHVYATYLHGPVLPKNPWLADQLIRIALERRLGRPVELEPLDDSVEQHAHDVALQKALRNRGQRTALEPARLVRDKAPQTVG
ncbi:MAG: glutamine amidotransferase [Chloroflexi bacterium]|nr:glutamine amidotransferase [Chloroflexota bacterium]